MPLPVAAAGGIHLMELASEHKKAGTTLLQLIHNSYNNSYNKSGPLRPAFISHHSVADYLKYLS